MTNSEIRRLVRQLVHPDRAGHAYKILVQLGSDAVVPLCQALSNPDMRWYAASALGQIGDARAVQPLIQALGDEDQYFQNEVAKALVKLGSPAVRPLLAAREDKNAATRRNAASVLRLIGDSRVVEPLIQALGDKDPMVRHYGAGMLGNLKNVDAVEPLVRALGDTHPGVREKVVEALVNIGSPAAMPLIGRLGDENPDVRLDAIEALKKIGDTDTILRLILKETSLTPQQRFTVMSALDRVPDIRAFCQQKLEDIHESVQQGAQAVLDVSILLIPSNRNTTPDKAELLRSAEPSIANIEPEEMLRASDRATVPSPNLPKPRGLIARLLGR